MPSTTAAGSFFEKVANDVLDMTDQISALITGEFSNGAAKESQDNGGAFQESLLDDEFLQGLSEEERMLFQEQMMYGSPLQGIADSVMNNILSSQVGPQTPMEHFQAFKSAIDWTEPFIHSLILFHILVFSLCIYVSRPTVSSTPRLVVLGCIAILVRSAEYINSWAANHWKDFATQNYFDKRGVFIGIMLCAPLLISCFIMLIMFLKEAAKLVVDIKVQKATKTKKQQGEKQTDASKDSNNKTNRKGDMKQSKMTKSNEKQE